MAKQRELPILRVVQIGNDEFERYCIEDQQNRVWTGERFGSKGGALFARHYHAAAEAQNILKKNFVGLEPQRYVVPLFVEVFSHKPVNIGPVAQYLSDSSRLFVDSTTHGNGPNESLVLSRIEWSQMEATKELPHE